MKNGRLHWLLPEELTPEQKSLYDTIVDSPRAVNRPTPLTDGQGRLNGPFNAMMTNPPLGERVQALALVLRFSGGLPRLVFETIVLIVASERRASYEWYAHAPIAQAAGLTDDHLNAIRESRYSELDAVLGRDLLNLVLSALRHEAPTQQTVRAVEETYGAENVTAAVVTVAHFDLIATLMRTWDSQLPVGVSDPFATGSAAV